MTSTTPTTPTQPTNPTADDLYELMKSLKDSPDIFAKAIKGFTAVVNGSVGDKPIIYIACISDEQFSIDIIKVLIDNGADPNSKFNYEPLIHFTSIPIEKREYLINRGADPNAFDSRGNTRLRHAAACNKLDETKMLIKYADLNLKSHDGETPLHRAACFGYSDIVEILLNGGADPEIKNNSEQTALDVAVERGHARCAVLIMKFKKEKKLQISSANQKPPVVEQTPAVEKNGDAFSVKALKNAWALLTSDQRYLLTKTMGGDEMAQFKGILGAEY